MAAPAPPRCAPAGVSPPLATACPGAPGPFEDPRELRLASLARAGAPLRRALAGLAARWVRTRGWEALGFARLRDHAVERLGLSARQVHELARMDAALRERPALEAAHLGGRLPWTKLRLVARASPPGDVAEEARWIALAERLPCDALAREVRALDARAVERSDAGAAPGAAAGATAPPPEEPEPEPRETVRLRCSAATRAKLWRVRQVARRAAGEPLPPWGAMEAMAAEVLSAVGLSVDPDAPPCQGEGATREGPTEPPRCDGSSVRGGYGPAATWAAARGALACRVAPEESGAGAVCAARSEDASEAPASPAFLAGLTRGLEALDARGLEARLRRAARLEQRLLARMGPLLRAVASERLYRGRGFRGLDAYARERLGMAPDRARTLLRLERAGLVAPALGRAWRSGRIGWSRAQALVPLVALEHARPCHAGWIARAARVTVRRLEDDVGLAVARGDPDPEHLPALPTLPARPARSGEEGLPAGLGIRATSTASGEDPAARVPAALRRREPVRFFFSAPHSVARLFRAVLATAQRRIERHRRRPSSEDEALEAMCEHALAAWDDRPLARVPREHAVFERDGWRCTAPACSSYRNLQEHHVVFRSAGGTDALENRVTLCAWHHLRGVHAGRIRVEGRAPERLRYAMPFGTYASGDHELTAPLRGTPSEALPDAAAPVLG